MFDTNAIQVGSIVTRFGEKATRVERRSYDQTWPAWFNPSGNKAHNAIHRNGESIYFAIALDTAAREAAHPFTNEIAPNSISIEQLGFVL